MSRTWTVRTLVAALATTTLFGGCGQDPRQAPRSEPAAQEPVLSAPEAQCAALLDYDGHRYVGYGDLKRDPATTGRVDTGRMPACDDGIGPAPAQRVRISELVDISPRRAVLVDESLYVRSDRPFPSAARPWFVTPACETAGRFELGGQWLSVEGRDQPRFDGDIRPPLRLGLHVSHGPRNYRGSTIQIRATKRTEPALGPKDVKASLWKGGGLKAQVRCVNGDFLAISLTSTPG